VWLAAVGLVLLVAAGCAGLTETSDKEAEGVPRPEWRVGDRWVFRRTTLRGASSVVTHQVIAATAGGYTVRVLGAPQETLVEWTRDLHLVRWQSGTATARFDPPARYFVWPIKPGQTWAQEFAYADGARDGRYENGWTIGDAVERVDVVAGRFYALRIEHRGSAGERLETYWYNALARYWVRLEDYQRGYAEELVEYSSWGP
jgi:hypothetical protein